MQIYYVTVQPVQGVGVKIMLAWVLRPLPALRERPFTSKGSRVAAESDEGAALRMGGAELLHGKKG